MTERFTGQIALSEDEGIKTATIDLEEQDIDEYYNGYANRTLWPLFHYRIDLAEYDRTFEGGYNRVNEHFADTVCPLTEPEDIIWVHDYHMIPLGQMLRDRGLANRIGFFLHIPWPDRKSTRLNSVTNAHLVCRHLLEKKQKSLSCPSHAFSCYQTH